MPKLIILFFSIIKSIYINFRILPFNEALKLPIFITYNTRIKCKKGCLKINSEWLRPFMIKIGVGDVGIFDKRKSKSIVIIYGKIVFKGRAFIGHGTKINCNKNGNLIIGDNFTVTAESNIICSKEIAFGNDNLISWNVLIMDTDFHKIFDANNNTRINSDESIVIGDKVWISANSTILKGSRISHGTIVGASSLVSKKFNDEKIIIAGNPAKKIRENIEWRN
ncbi:acyltransferase [Bacillus sp. AFS041924]|uniref:acyltransferase n=1 Tax=Bacillus sp. AFS041924 TaxID=2033503 RepID=UPI000BFBF51D|nr:acyltransferase [Bacillus sp. AFS041924]PGS56027.1 hypothetical protein COC46_01980 [Bacillus sp. AFS041924]